MSAPAAPAGTAPVVCPHCEAELAPEEIRSMWGVFTNGLRTKFKGQKAKPTKCAKCGVRCRTAREARAHCQGKRSE